MKIRLRLLAIAVALGLLLMPVTTALAVPVVPLLYQGSVDIDSVGAPIGTIVTAEIDGGEVATNAPGGTTEVGAYVLQIVADEGDVVVLKVDGVPGGQTTHPDPMSTYKVDLDLSVGEAPEVPPVAGFSASPLTGNAPLTVEFTDESLNMADSPTWYWEFGDVMCPYCEAGPFDTLAEANEHIATEHPGEALLIYIDWDPPYDPNAQNPIHQYLQVGTYTVTLTVTTAYGSDTEVKADYIVVLADVPPPSLTANAGMLTYYVAVGEEITLSGSASGGTSPYTYAWDLDNDGQYDDAAVASPPYTWDTAGTYTIGLEVTDSVLDTATDTATVMVSEEAFDPYNYDTDSNGELSRDETLVAVNDYLAANITKDNALEVVKLYFA